MSQQSRILYCHCAYAQVIPSQVKNEVLDKLAASGVAFDAVPDLCEMAARSDPALKSLAAQPGLKIAACFARAVRSLFISASAPLPEEGVEIMNMRTEPAHKVVFAILGEGFGDREGM